MAQNGLKFPSELCFGTMNLTKDSYLLNSKVASLKSGQNAAGICPFFYSALDEAESITLFSTVASMKKSSAFAKLIFVSNNVNVQYGNANLGTFRKGGCLCIF